MKRILTISGIAMLFSSVSFAQLNGTYTINASSAASATNYLSVSAAISDLSTGTRSDGGPVNGPGVSGPVTLRITTGSGPYLEQISIPAITGASATNTIRLTGGPGRETMTFSGTTTADRHVIKLNGCRHVTLDSLTLVNTDAVYGYGVHITNSADSNRVTNNIVIVDNTSTSANFAGITISGATVTTAGDFGDDNLIQGNSVNGGYYGITMRGTSTTVFNQRNKVLNNTIQNVYYYGIYCYSQNLTEIIGNTISARSGASTSAYGMYLYYAEQYKVERNYINNFGTYGIYTYYGNYQGGTGTARARIVNNMIGGNFSGTTPYGMYITTNSRNLDIWHNSVSLNSGNGRCIYILGGNGNDVRNNSLAAFNSTSAYALYVSSTTYVSTVNYNNYYAPGSTNFIFIGAAYTTANFIGGGGYNANSRQGDPVYTSNASNLHSSAVQLFDAGTNVGVTEDIDGQTRPMAPTAIYDIGADEYNASLNDAGITAMTSPAQPFAPGIQNVSAVVYNYGAAMLTSATINWDVNSVPQTPFAWTGSLATNASSSPATLGTYNFLAGTPYTIRIWTTNPNGSSDQNNTNDTLVMNVCTSMNGVYTIGGVGADFATINSAVSALVCGGVSGPVTMRLNPGTGPFNEQVIIPAIPGASATRTVRFTGGPGRETVQYGLATNAERAVIKINGARHIILDSLRILNSSTAYGYGVQITNSGDSNTVSNSIVLVDSLTTSSNFAGITFSGATVTTNGDNGDGNAIMNNTVVGGYYGIAIRGISTTVFNLNNKITGNTIRRFYYYGIQCYQQDLSVITDNVITARPTSTTAAYGMYLYYAERFNVERNKINSLGTYGIYSYYGNYQGGTGTARARIANNMIGGSWLATTPYGIYLSTNARNIDVWHNSVSIVNADGRALYITSGSGNDVRNNSFAVFGSATGYAAYVSLTSYVSGMNYNNYYSGGSSNFIYVGAAYNTSTYVGGGGFNLNSRHGDPYYVNNASDLHCIGAPQLYDAGTNLGITNDIDGQTRPLVPSVGYDIGADEYTAIMDNSTVISLIAPANQSCPDSNAAVTVVIQNLGADTIFNMQIAASYTGFTSGSINYTYNDTLPFGVTDTITIGSVNANPGGPLTFTVYTLLTGDQDNSNDTLVHSITVLPYAPVATGVSDTICPGDSAVIAANYDTFGHNWFDQPTGGTMVAVGDTFHTPALFTNTTYYIESLTRSNGDLVTTYAGGNGCAGAMFDFVPNVNMSIDSFGVNIGVTTAENVRVYYKLGTFAGFETNATAWTQLGQTSVIGAGAGNETMVPIGGLTMTAGQTYGIYVTLQNTNIDYTNGTTTFGNADATIMTGTGLCSLFGGTNPGRMFNGTVYYTKEVCPNPVRTPVTVVLRTPPVVALGFDTIVCGSHVLNAGNPGMTYQWSTGDSTQQITANTSGSYSVGVTDMFSCVGRDTIMLTVNPLPPVVAVAGSGNVCAGSADTLTASGAVGYNWSTGGLSAVEVVNPTVATTYTVTGMDLNGCTDTATVTVNVMALPSVGYSVSSGQVCAGGSVTLNGTGAISYSWTGGVNDGVSFVPASTTTYIVTGTDANGCSDTASALVVVNALPAVGYSSSSDTACANSQVTLSGTGAVSYAWSGGVTDNVPFTVSTSATYSVTGTDANGCSNTATASIFVNPAPAVGYTASADTVCENTSVTLSGTGAVSYSWSGGITDAVAFVPASSGAYVVTGTDANGCTANDTANIVVNTLPVVTVSLPFSSICFDDASAALTGGSPAGGTWSGNGVSGGSFDPSVAGNGAQMITYTYTDANGCTNSGTQTVSVSPCTGIADPAQAALFSFYPNPNNGAFTLQLNGSSSARLVIYDAIGQMVQNAQIQPGTHQLNIAAGGVYMIAVTTDDGQQIRQSVVVQR